MSTSNKIALALTLVSLGLLVPGVMLPVFHFSMHASLDAKVASFSGDVVNETRSILGTVAELWQRDRMLVAALVFVFSVAVPAIKMLLIVYGLIVVRHAKSVFIVLRHIGKWSMADVYLIAILLTYMSTHGHAQQKTENVSIFGMQFPVSYGLQMNAQLEPGFYYFAAYCLVSLLAIQLVSEPTLQKETLL